MLFQKAHHLVDDGLFLFLLCSGFAGLVGIDVGIVQGRFHVGILLSELVFRQSDGCLLVQALAVAFVAQGEEEVVAVACPEPGGALHGSHGLGEYQLLPRFCVLRCGGRGGGRGCTVSAAVLFLPLSFFAGGMMRAGNGEICSSSAALI